MSFEEMKGLWASVVMSIAMQSVKDGILLESWVRFATQAHLKEFAMCWSPQTVMCMTAMLAEAEPKGTDMAGY